MLGLIYRVRKGNWGKSTKITAGKAAIFTFL